MWGPSIVGLARTATPTRVDEPGVPWRPLPSVGRELVVYLAARKKQRSLLAKLGKHKMKGCCLYFKQLADLDK